MHYNERMIGIDFFERVLGPVGEALSHDAAKRLVDVKADPDLQNRIDFLADRANEGVLTLEERGEYESLIAVATVIAVLKSKAHALLARLPAA